MCFPALAAIPAALASVGSAAAGAFQTIGAGLSAAGAAASALQRTRALRANQALAKHQARVEGQRGAFEARRLRERGQRLLGTRRAGFLANGVALEGSAFDALSDTASELSLDEQAVRFGSRVRVDNALFQARQAGANARFATIGGAINALSPIIDGLGKRPPRNGA